MCKCVLRFCKKRSTRPPMGRGLDTFTQMKKVRSAIYHHPSTSQSTQATCPQHYTTTSPFNFKLDSFWFIYPFLCSVMATQTPRGENTMTIVPENTMSIVPLFASHHGISGKHKYEYNHRKISRKFLCKRILGKFHCIFYTFTQIGYV